MLVWRICRKHFADAALDGSGGLHASGRWHHRGVPVVYAAGSAALAALEVLVHVDPAQAPSDLVLLGVEVSDRLDIEVVNRDSLPAGWQTTPAPTELQDLGTAWLRRRRTAVLQVPSVLVPVGDNFLINPRHRGARRLRVVVRQAFSFDARLLRGD